MHTLNAMWILIKVSGKMHKCKVFLQKVSKYYNFDVTWKIKKHLGKNYIKRVILLLKLSSQVTIWFLRQNPPESCRFISRTNCQLRYTSNNTL